MLKTAIINWLTRDVAAIVAFFHGLEKRLEDWLAQHEVEIAKIKTDIADVETEASKRVSELEAEIAEKISAAEVIIGLKKALPTAQ